ncbi:hypothetical protein FBU59_002888, partial [Linderina macrospora]
MVANTSGSDANTESSPADQRWSLTTPEERDRFMAAVQDRVVNIANQTTEIAAFKTVFGREPHGVVELDTFKDDLDEAVTNQALILSGGRPRRRVARPVSYADIVQDLEEDHRRRRAPKRTRMLKCMGTKSKSTTGEQHPQPVEGLETGSEQKPTQQPVVEPQMSIAELICSTNTTIRVSSTDNRPSVDDLLRIDFKPLVFSATADEPAHFIIGNRTNDRTIKRLHQTQGLHEYDLEEFLTPIEPEAFLTLQRAKYVPWLMQQSNCRKVDISLVTQTINCLSSNGAGMPQCKSCLFRQTECFCRFNGIRKHIRLFIELDDGSTRERYLYSPILQPQTDPSIPTLNHTSPEAPTTAIEPGTLRVRALTAEAFKIQLEAMHSIVDTAHDGYGVHPVLSCSAAPVIYRDHHLGTRQICDICRTTITAVYLTCSACAVELCYKCFAEWDDSEVTHRVSLGHKAPGGPYTAETYPKHISVCKRIARRVDMYPALHSFHRRSQFVRVSQYTPLDVDFLSDQVQAAIQNGSTDTPIDTNVLETKIKRIQDRTHEMLGLAEWELAPLYVDKDELSADEFSYVWKRGIVVVVRGLLDKLKREIWKPEWWIKNFGDELVQILDCKQMGVPVGEWPLKDFYRAFDGDGDEYRSHFEESDTWKERSALIKSHILKLKDWPPTEGFEERLPDHFSHFMEALPFQDFTSRAGKYNLANRLPAAFIPPDLGPKMYCAYGSSDSKGGVGTTNLHCDMADAVNIMAYASKKFLAENQIGVPGIWVPDENDTSSTSGEAAVSSGFDDGGSKVAAAAVWDIYPPAAVENLRT